MDGHALGREILARTEGAAPLVVALTGYGQAKDREESRAAGFDLHLVKPIDAKTILQTIATAKRGS